MHKRFTLLAVVVLLATSLLAAHAGQTVLSINSGTGSASWFITGETTLVMNGFDLTAFQVALPATIDRVSIAVDNPIPNTPIELVIYEDANGGSPVDARLVGRATVTINTTGTFTTTLAAPVTVNAPAVWIGFYLPVDFRFLADTSGSSVLTYWAWTPNSTFDLTNLSTAAVFGPADGSAPVNINLNGRARITAEITGATGTPGGNTPGTGTVDLSVLAQFPACGAALYDTADERVTWEDRINLHCAEVTATYLIPNSPAGYTRKGVTYDIQIYKSGGVIVFNRLEYAVTMCIRPDAGDIDRAVIGNAYGAPRQWRILPTQRFGDLVCAEVRHGGGLAYFVQG